MSVLLQIQLKAMPITGSYTCSQHFVLFEEVAPNLIATDQKKLTFLNNHYTVLNRNTRVWAI